jgi:predicted RNase H-like HicB family nuclease
MARAKRSEANSGAGVFTAVIEPDREDGGYVVTFPALRDLATQGETIEEARWMAEDCLRGYLDALRAANRTLPGSGAPVPPDDRVALRFQISAV